MLYANTVTLTECYILPTQISLYTRNHLRNARPQQRITLPSLFYFCLSSILSPILLSSPLQLATEFRIQTKMTVRALIFPLILSAIAHPVSPVCSPLPKI